MTRTTTRSTPSRTGRSPGATPQWALQHAHLLLTRCCARAPCSQRLASFLVYLNDWPSGGETVFPLEGPGGLERLRNIDYRSCAQGLKVKPMRTGDALLFYSIHPNTTFDKVRADAACCCGRAC